jgi:hypothetical protein
VTGVVQNPSDVSFALEISFAFLIDEVSLNQEFSLIAISSYKVLPLLLIDTDHFIEEAQSGRFVPLERIASDD